jgi:hypothetical protein
MEEKQKTISLRKLKERLDVGAATIQFDFSKIPDVKQTFKFDFGQIIDLPMGDECSIDQYPYVTFECKSCYYNISMGEKKFSFIKYCDGRSDANVTVRALPPVENEIIFWTKKSDWLLKENYFKLPPSPLRVSGNHSLDCEPWLSTKIILKNKS